MHRSLPTCALLLFSACAAPRPAAVSPGAEAATAPGGGGAEPDRQGEGAPSAEHAADSPPNADSAKSGEAASAAATASESLSPGDLRSVLQAVLNDPELDGYLHTNKPGRTPVKLAGPDLPKDLGLVKAGKAVSIVEQPKSPKDAVIVVTKIEIEGDLVTVAYRYDVEGIRGTTRISRSKGAWELKSSRIMEH